MKTIFIAIIIHAALLAYSASMDFCIDSETEECMTSIEQTQWEARKAKIEQNIINGVYSNENK